MRNNTTSTAAINAREVPNSDSEQTPQPGRINLEDIFSEVRDLNVFISAHEHFVCELQASGPNSDETLAAISAVDTMGCEIKRKAAVIQASLRSFIAASDIANLTVGEAA